MLLLLLASVEVEADALHAPDDTDDVLILVTGADVTIDSGCTIITSGFKLEIYSKKKMLKS